MKYNHVTPNLKQPLTKQEMDEHISLLKKTLPCYQTTGYTAPTGAWEKHVSRNSFTFSPVDGNFGISVGQGEPASYFHHRIFTLYPLLNLAVLDKGYKFHYSGRHARAFPGMIQRLQTLGYEVAKEISSWERGKDPRAQGVQHRPFYIAARTRDLFHEESTLAQIVSNLTQVLAYRPTMPFCELIIFSPPGDGAWNSPIGKVKPRGNHDYGNSHRNNIDSTYFLPLINGRPSETEVAALLKTLDPHQALGITSHGIRMHSYTSPRAMQLEQTELFSPLEKKTIDNRFEQIVLPATTNLHIPMVDFQCSTPEEAIHTLERLGVSVTPSTVILIDSGNSFHAHLPTLYLSAKDAAQFLSKLKEHDTVCEKWVPLQSKQGYQLLRLTPCMQKPYVPTLLDL